MSNFQNNSLNNKEKVTVEGLKNFPFKTFIEFKESYLKNKIKILIDQSALIRWAQRGLYRPLNLYYKFLLIAWIPYLSIFIFIAISIIIKKYILLLLVPLFFLAAIFLHPTGRGYFKLLKILWLMIIVLFFWSLLTKNINWLLISSVLNIIWIFEKITYDIVHFSLTKALLEHEDLLCYLWDDNKIIIKFINEKILKKDIGQGQKGIKILTYSEGKYSTIMLKDGKKYFLSVSPKKIAIYRMIFIFPFKKIWEFKFPFLIRTSKEAWPRSKTILNIVLENIKDVENSNELLSILENNTSSSLKTFAGIN